MSAGNTSAPNKRPCPCRYCQSKDECKSNGIPKHGNKEFVLTIETPNKPRPRSLRISLDSQSGSDGSPNNNSPTCHCHCSLKHENTLNPVLSNKTEEPKYVPEKVVYEKYSYVYDDPKSNFQSLDNNNKTTQTKPSSNEQDKLTTIRQNNESPKKQRNRSNKRPQLDVITEERSRQNSYSQTESIETQHISAESESDKSKKKKESFSETPEMGKPNSMLPKWIKKKKFVNSKNVKHPYKAKSASEVNSSRTEDTKNNTNGYAWPKSRKKRYIFSDKLRSLKDALKRPSALNKTITGPENASVSPETPDADEETVNVSSKKPASGKGPAKVLFKKRNADKGTVKAASKKTASDKDSVKSRKSKGKADKADKASQHTSNKASNGFNAAGAKSFDAPEEPQRRITEDFKDQTKPAEDTDSRRSKKIKKVDGVDKSQCTCTCCSIAGHNQTYLLEVELVKDNAPEMSSPKAGEELNNSPRSFESSQSHQRNDGKRTFSCSCGSYSTGNNQINPEKGRTLNLQDHNVGHTNRPRSPKDNIVKPSGSPKSFESSQRRQRNDAKRPCSCSCGSYGTDNNQIKPENGKTVNLQHHDVSDTNRLRSHNDKRLKLSETELNSSPKSFESGQRRQRNDTKRPCSCSCCPYDTDNNQMKPEKGKTVNLQDHDIGDTNRPRSHNNNNVKSSETNSSPKSFESSQRRQRNDSKRPCSCSCCPYRNSTNSNQIKPEEAKRLSFQEHNIGDANRPYASCCAQTQTENRVKSNKRYTENDDKRPCSCFRCPNNTDNIQIEPKKEKYQQNQIELKTERTRDLQDYNTDENSKECCVCCTQPQNSKEIKSKKHQTSTDGERPCPCCRCFNIENIGKTDSFKNLTESQDGTVMESEQENALSSHDSRGDFHRTLCTDRPYNDDIKYVNNKLENKKGRGSNTMDYNISSCCAYYANARCRRSEKPQQKSPPKQTIEGFASNLRRQYPFNKINSSQTDDLQQASCCFCSSKLKESPPNEASNASARPDFEFDHLNDVEPGKGLLAYSQRLSYFCKSSDSKTPLLEVPKEGKVVPRRRPQRHKLSFLDDPPYSTINKSYDCDSSSDAGAEILNYEYHCCQCCKCANSLRKYEEDDGEEVWAVSSVQFKQNAKNENIKPEGRYNYYRHNLPKWITNSPTVA